MCSCHDSPEEMLTIWQIPQVHQRHHQSHSIKLLRSHRPVRSRQSLEGCCRLDLHTFLTTLFCLLFIAFLFFGDTLQCRICYYTGALSLGQHLYRGGKVCVSAGELIHTGTQGVHIAFDSMLTKGIFIDDGIIKVLIASYHDLLH